MELASPLAVAPAAAATVVAAAFVAAAFVAYTGYFNEEMRAAMMVDIKEQLEQAKPPVLLKENLSIAEFLSTPDNRLQWSRNGLPPDNLCVENAVMLSRFNQILEHKVNMPV